MRRIETLSDIEAGLTALRDLDPRLEPVIALAGPVPLRRRAPGFEGLARIVVGQQVSVAAADAIWARLAGLVAPFEPANFAAQDDGALRAAGLSQGKVRSLRAVVAAVADGRIDLDGAAALPAAEVHASMIALPGIGPWTADIFLLFCAGHADIWPAGDLALEHAVADAFGLEARPSNRQCQGIAAQWSPWRGVAARLFWAFYAARRRNGRSALPV